MNNDTIDNDTIDNDTIDNDTTDNGHRRQLTLTPSTPPTTDTDTIDTANNKLPLDVQANEAHHVSSSEREGSGLDG